jgi:hypothetical protein
VMSELMHSQAGPLKYPLGHAGRTVMRSNDRSGGAVCGVYPESHCRDRRGFSGRWTFALVLTRFLV